MEGTALQWVIPHKVCYKTVKEGCGEVYDGEARVVLSYQILDEEGTFLGGIHRATLDCSLLLPSFVHGIKGMKEGEMRNIYIHPSMGYGVHTLANKGKALVFTVTLDKVLKGNVGSYPLPESMDLDFVFDPVLYGRYEREEGYRGVLHGSERRSYLEKLSEISIDGVSLHLKELSANLNNHCVLSVQEEELLNRFYWNYYFSKTVSPPKRTWETEQIKSEFVIDNT